MWRGRGKGKSSDLSDPNTLSDRIARGTFTYAGVSGCLLGVLAALLGTHFEMSSLPVSFYWGGLLSEV